jgi:hypothetical protein
MSGRARALPIPGHAREVRVSAYVTPDGRPGLFWTGPPPRFAYDRPGSGAYHGVELYAIGRAGAVQPVAVLSPRECRALARALTIEAARLEASERIGRQW